MLAYRDKEKNRQVIKAWNRAHNKQLKLEMIAAYGGKCVCCGETESFFLTLDHIFDDGAEDRRQRKTGGGSMMYEQLRKEGWPQGRLQLLCWNCNCGRRLNDGICPHTGHHAY